MRDVSVKPPPPPAMALWWLPPCQGGVHASFSNHLERLSVPLFLFLGAHCLPSNG